jgi:HAD superfamily hydrolase (TIGR01484 family)
VQSLDGLSRDSLTPVRYILTDIDDTLTRGGKLLPEAYSALWRLEGSQRIVIPVTGRPAGWCDCIIRQWPVRAVVGENGAFALFERKGEISVLLHPEVEAENEGWGNGNGLRARFPEASGDPRLEDIYRAIKEEIPEARKAKDQFGRLYDLAVDFREDEPKLDLSAAERMKDIAEEHGARAKVSSIHVNIWFGDYDKLGMTCYMMSEVFGLSEAEVKQQVMFVGDSPNDEPMFRFFPVSVGVANVREYEGMMTSLPKYCTRSPYGIGFAEAAVRLME